MPTEISIKAKEKGNKAFGKKDFKQAIIEYTKALEGCDEELKPLLYSNRSASHFRLAHYELALEDSQQVIDIQSDWMKGHFRKGEALFALHRFEEAADAYSQALRLDRNDYLLQKIVRCQAYGQDTERGLFILQLLSGRDFCIPSLLAPIQKMIFAYAKEMKNFVYVVGCENSKECVVIDCCWDVDRLLKIIKERGWKLTGAIITHCHFDHIGGLPPAPYNQYNIKVDGIAKLLKKCPEVRAYVHLNDFDEVKKANAGLDTTRFVFTCDGFRLKVGSHTLEFLHTPGHTPGSQCVLVDNSRLLSGDTLFYRSIGRADFESSNKSDLYKSLRRLSRLPEEVVVFAGHQYGADLTTIADEKRYGMLREMSFEEFLQM